MVKCGVLFEVQTSLGFKELNLQVYSKVVSGAIQTDRIFLYDLIG
jgi:hypothetical protein